MNNASTTRSAQPLLIARRLWLWTVAPLLTVLLPETFAPELGAAPPAVKRFEAFEWNLDLPERPVSRRVSRAFGFRGPEPTVLADIEGPGCIRRFWITGNNIGRDVILRIYFDGHPIPYVEAPLAND